MNPKRDSQTRLRLIEPRASPEPEPEPMRERAPAMTPERFEALLAKWGYELIKENEEAEARVWASPRTFVIVTDHGNVALGGPGERSVKTTLSELDLGTLRALQEGRWRS